MSLRTIAVDFDGVIHAYSKGYHDGTIYDGSMPGAFAALGELMIDYAVFVFTSRDVNDVATWLYERGGFNTRVDDPRARVQVVDTEPDGSRHWRTRNILLVTNRKLVALAYIDDRGIRFEDWDQTLDDLKRWYGSPS